MRWNGVLVNLVTHCQRTPLKMTKTRFRPFQLRTSF
jgi:hypothetical protein